MRKFMIPFLAVMLSFSIAACGGNSDSDSKEKTTQSDKKKDSGKKKKKDKKSKKDKKKDKDKKKKDKKVEEDTEETDESKKNSQALSMDRTVVVDNDECTITITGAEDSTWGYTILKAQLENKSSDKTYNFSVDNATIDGVACDSFLSTDVAPGKKANDDIIFYDTEFKELGVEYTDISLLFRVRDNDDWTADPIVVESVHIYPYGEDKATVFEREPQDSDNIIMDNEYCTVIVTGYKDDKVLGYIVQFYLVNKSDKILRFSAENVSVNGFMLEPYFSTYVPAGANKFAPMSWGKETFKENDITKVDEIEFNLIVGDNEDWAVDYANETIKLTPDV